MKTLEKFPFSITTKLHNLKIGSTATFVERSDTQTQFILEVLTKAFDAKKNAAATTVETNNDKPEVKQSNNDEQEVKLRDKLTPIPYQGQKSLVTIYRRPIVFKLKLSNSCRQKRKK